MPTYLYDCSLCHQQVEHIHTIAEMLSFEATAQPCSCGGTLNRNYKPRRHVTFHAGVYENIDKDPMHIDSAQQLVDECRKRDNSSAYMKDMAGLFGAKENRWI